MAKGNRNARPNLAVRLKKLCGTIESGITANLRKYFINPMDLSEW